MGFSYVKLMMYLIGIYDVSWELFIYRGDDDSIGAG